MKAFGRDAHDGERMSVHRSRPPDHIWIAVELRLPVVIAENDDGVLAKHLAFAAQKEPSRSRLQSEAFKQVAADVSGHDALRLLAWCREPIKRNGVSEHVAEGVPAPRANLLELGP